jgi:hypothetical protein
MAGQIPKRISDLIRPDAPAAAARAALGTSAEAASAARAAHGATRPPARRLALRPTPTLLAPTVVTSATRPLWLSADGLTLWGRAATGANTPNLYQSTDDGVTWTQLATFPHSVKGVRQLANGQLLVSVERVASSVPTGTGSGS